MRNRILILAAMLLTGCVAEQPAMQTVTMPAGDELASAALVFDAPITLDQPSLNLSRATRGNAAFVGFEDSTISYYDIITDNRQTADSSDSFIRESVTQRVGSIRR